MASFMAAPLLGSLEPSQVPAQASQLQGAVAPGELVDPLGGQGANGAGVDPQVLFEEPAHLPDGRDRGAAHRNDLVGQGLFGRGDQERLVMVRFHPDHAGFISPSRDLPVDEEADRRAEPARTIRRDRRQGLDPLRDEPVIGERIIERDIGGAIDEIGQQFLRIRIPSVLSPKTYNPFLILMMIPCLSMSVILSLGEERPFRASVRV